MSIVSRSITVAGMAALLGPPASAASSAESDANVPFPTAVATFQKTCLVPGVDPKDRLTAIEADGRWTEDAIVSVNVPQMAISRTISQNYSFNAPASVRQWTGLIDDQKVRLVTATFAGKVRYPNLCAIVLEGADNALPYGGPLREAFKAFGISGKSVDLVHYFEFAGKVGVGKNPVRGEVFSRSLSGQIKQTMHIYIAY